MQGVLAGNSTGIVIAPNPNRWAIIASTLTGGPLTLFTDFDDPVNGGVLITTGSLPFVSYFTQVGRWVQSGFGVRNDSAVNGTMTITEIIYIPPPTTGAQ